MDILKLQKGLLDWFWFEPDTNKSFNSIDNICINLYQQYFQEKSVKSAVYDIFYSLIRYGLIEFYGDNKYGLSPSSALYSDKKVLFCNIPIELQQKEEFTCVFDTHLGIEVYEKFPLHLHRQKENGILYSKFVFSDYLKTISSFETIINSWKNDTVIDSNGYSFFNSNNTWSNNSLKISNGVFKKTSEVYAQRVYKVSDNKWKYIPSRENNIDGFHIAVIWGQIQNNWDIKIKYHANESKIVVNNIFFPIIIERLLFLNTLLEGKFDFDFFKRQYFIKQKDFYILNKIFNNKIEVI